VKYWYQRDGKAIPKQVSFFLMRYLGGGPGRPRPRSRARAVDAVARRLEELSFPGERKMVRAAIAYRQSQHG